MTLQVGDVLLVHSHSFIGRVIRVFTDSYYSHTAVFIGEVFGVSCVLEADWRGVFINKVEKYAGVEFSVARSVSQEKVLDRIRVGMQEIGKRYDFKQLVGFAISLLLRKKYNPFDSPDRYICSELVNKMYDYRIGRKGLTSPQTIAKSSLFKLLTPPKTSLFL